MTRANCERLLAHYRAVGNKEAEADMMANMKARGYKEDPPSKGKK